VTGEEIAKTCRADLAYYRAAWAGMEGKIDEDAFTEECMSKVVRVELSELPPGY
jgi:hypothetical protein